MKQDKVFSVAKVYTGRRDWAARGAVFTPLLGPDWKDLGVKAALNILRSMWRHRLSELRGMGWPPVLNFKDFVYARNCPPFGVATSTKVRICGRTHLCPFCFARCVFSKALDHCEHLLLAPLARGVQVRKGVSRVPLDPTLKLIEFRAATPDIPSAWRDDAGKMAPYNPAEMGDQLYEFVRGQLTYRRTEVQNFEAVGGAVLHTVKLSDKHCKLVRSGLLLTRRVAPIVPYNKDDKNNRYEVHEAPTWKTLTDCAARVFRYPDVLLLRCPPALLAVLLVALHKTRLLATYGKVASCV